MSSYVLSAIRPRRFMASARRSSLVKRLGQLFADSREASEARRFAAELVSMSDRQLIDIGRDEVACIAQGGRR